MKVDEFNKKWQNRLEDGHYGMAINNEEVINLVDKYFTDFEINYTDFTFSQIKLKFGYLRIYANNVNQIVLTELENKINEILKQK